MSPALSGTVDERQFRLRSVLRYRNSFAPVATGSYASGIRGTHLTVRLRLARPVAAFTTVWLSGAAVLLVIGIVFAARHPERPWLAAAALGLLAFGYGLTTVAFALEARKLGDNIAAVLAGARPQDLRRTEPPSWLLTVKLPNAPPTERWFNRAFLTAYAVAGVLAVYAWEHTASACTNPQYDRPDEYSCPSTGRIVFTWVLLLALIGTMFLSRFVLWRRLRAAYVPLLLVVVAIGFIAVWLISHHPQWGVPRA